MKNKNFYGQCGNCVYSEPYKAVGKYNKIYCSLRRWICYESDTCKSYKGAYVTTAVCSILGKENFEDVLKDLQELRVSIMEIDPDCEKLLKRYDEVGPIIGRQLQEDYNKNKDNSLAMSLFKYYIEPTAKMIEVKDYMGAIEKYSAMEDILEDCFHLKQMDYTNVGEARLIKYKKRSK